MKLATILFTLALPSIAHANGTTEPTPFGPDAAIDARELRRGLHVGFSVGGAYLPFGEGASVFVGRLDLNFGRGWIEHRISPIVYQASSNGSTTGLGLAYEERVPIGSMFAIGGGVLVAHESTDEGSTAAYGFTLTPITLRLGERRNYELGLNALWVQEPDLGNQNFGGYISFTYLKL